MKFEQKIFCIIINLLLNKKYNIFEIYLYISEICNNNFKLNFNIFINIKCIKYILKFIVKFLMEDIIISLL